MAQLYSSEDAHCPYGLKNSDYRNKTQDVSEVTPVLEVKHVRKCFLGV